MQDIERSRYSSFDADEPPILLGATEGPNPGEYLLHALAACVTATLIYQLPPEGSLEEVESKVEGDVDLRGFLGTDKGVRNGFQNIRMSFEITRGL